MARLSADLIRRSPQFLSAIKERVLDLRGNKIAFIDNLGATEDQFDMIDLSDNEIVRLENFPFMNRLGTLLINNNKITCINPNLGEFLPKMHTLVLTNNRLTSLAEIDPLASLPKLQFLSLLDNTVTKQPDYRLYVIHKLKHLRLLDFKKVNQQERPEAAQKFHSNEAEEAAKKVAAKAYTPVVMDAQGTTEDQGPKVVAPTPAQITAIKALKDEETWKKYDYVVAHPEERTEAAQMYHSKEAEEAPKKVAAKAYTSVMMDAQGTTKDQGPKVVAPAPAQITAIKALSSAQVPAEYYVITKPDTNMAEASEEAQAEKMETDGQEQEDGADEQKRNDEGTIQEEIFGADLDGMYDILNDNIELYTHKYFVRDPFNFMFSRRKRPFLGKHVLPPPRRQEPGRPP
ncbi:U2 small nuclear ribonucleoprotein A'-like isoform X3 [Triticum dicoccoides]|uniref:U2 small nuclear ribonucleoprotein A'-like isoform X3 n=1 Tax=Triticum dicoccoides TaxID=85692 RepID=UPI00189046CB|nr:U2 small nuclear ribonucleoprotein A'-like isoform X3 [Triticum dicoccoides]